MKLRQSEALTVFYNHYCGISNVYSNFYYNSGNQYINAAFWKSFHNSIFFLLFHSSVNQTDSQVRIGLAELLVYFLRRPAVYYFRFFDKRSNNISLSAFFYLCLNKVINFFSAVTIPEKSANRFSSCRECIYYWNIQISVQYYSQGARNRCCSHYQYIWIFTFLR